MIRPEQEHIDAVISECRKPIIVSGEGFAFEAVGYHESVIAALADDLDAMRAAQADAIKAAVDKERERCLAPLREWFIDVRPPGDDEDEGPTCAKCAVTVTVGYGLEWEDGDVCDTCAADLFQVVAKLLRDSGAPAPGAVGK